MMTFDLRAEALARPLICAHRGVSGGNIPCNTVLAFEAALCQETDIVELDVCRSRDGGLYVFHPGMEAAHLGTEKPLKDMTVEEIAALRFINGDGAPTQCAISSFDEVLDQLRGRCYINVDKFWDHMEPVLEAVRRHDMAEQILVKTEPNPQAFSYMEQLAPDIGYMVIVSGRDEVSPMLRTRQLNYVGAEVLFAREDDPVASPKYIRCMRDNGLILWANAIVYDYHVVLAAGHDDDMAITGHPDESWGWLVDRGFSVIQTDWPLSLRRYLDQRSQ